jgi:hypothetical protein
MTDFQKAKLDISIQSIDFAHGGKKSRSTAWETLVGVLPLTILLFALGWYSYNSIVHYLGAGRDDTFIVLWTGMSLAEGHGLVNYNLEPTEMTSSILHTAIVAVLYMAAPDFVYTLNKLLGLLAGALVLIILYQRRQDLFGGKTAGTIAFAISVVALANSRAWLYWNMGGLETPFQALILFVYGLALVDFLKTPRKVFPLVILQTLYILVRPEGFLLILFTSLCILFRRLIHEPLPRRHLFLILGIPAFIFLCTLIYRYLNFGLLFPNPVYAKVQLGIDANALSTLERGIQYLRGFYSSSPYISLQVAVLIALAIQSIRMLIQRRYKPIPDQSTSYFYAAPFLGLILLNHLFVVSVGGDWMEFYRLIVPVVPLLVVLTTFFAFQMLKAALEKLRLPRSHPVIFANLALAALFLAAITANFGHQDNHEIWGYHNCSEKMNVPKLLSLSAEPARLDRQIMLTNCASSRDWLAVMPFIEEELPALYKASDQKLTIATFQMGFFPYFIKQTHPTMNIKFIDTVGLGDINIARMDLDKASFGVRDGVNIGSIFSGNAGELSRYILAQNPNMIYVLDATYRRRTILAGLGWSAIWDQPGAVIFVKEQK